MKSMKYFFSALGLLLIWGSCQNTINDDLSFVDSAAAPTKLSVLFDITQDNTGKVTITPNGEGAVFYEVYYGDATTLPVNVPAGQKTAHVYAEGVYSVKIIGHAINGKITEFIERLTVSFRAPENLAVTWAVDAGNNFKINLSASALYESAFKVFWGDVPNEQGQAFLEGQTVNHAYATVGNYPLKVVAYSGGADTSVFTDTVRIVDPVLIPITFESPTIRYDFVNFGGGVSTKIPNPQMNGINTSDHVARIVKGAPEVWAGSFISVGNPIDFSANKIFRMKVFSPRAGAKVLLKVENLTNPGIFFEKEVLTTLANEWEDLAFDYRAINTGDSYQKVVVIFDLGISGDGSPNFTWLYDDIRLTNQMPVGLLDLPVTFDMAGINYEVVDFGGNQSQAATDPTNPSNKVKRTTKTNGAQTWAGTSMGAGFTKAIPFTASKTQMSIRVYAPAAGLRVRLKVEDKSDPSRSVETEAMTQAADTWETLVFDFANQSEGTAAFNLAYTYNLASVFFDFGNAGTDKVFLWDDVTFLENNVTPNYLSLPINFQSTTLSYNFINFGGATATDVNNPDPSGINNSTRVGKLVKGAPEVWAGCFLQMVNPINFNTGRTFKIKVYAPRVGAKLLLKVENASSGGTFFEKEAISTVANAWEELTFDYSAINTANAYSKVVLIFDLGIAGDGSSNFTYYFDDITLN